MAKRPAKPADQGSADDADEDGSHGADPADAKPAGIEDWLDLGKFIRDQREVARLSMRRLAELADVSNPYLSQIERGLRRPSAEILQQLANALRISVETLYVRAGILSADELRSATVSEAIAQDGDLTDDQKQALLNVYRSFVGTND